MCGEQAASVVITSTKVRVAGGSVYPTAMRLSSSSAAEQGHLVTAGTGGQRGRSQLVVFHIHKRQTTARFAVGSGLSPGIGGSGGGGRPMRTSIAIEDSVPNHAHTPAVICIKKVIEGFINISHLTTRRIQSIYSVLSVSCGLGTYTYSIEYTVIVAFVDLRKSRI